MLIPPRLSGPEKQQRSDVQLFERLAPFGNHLHPIEDFPCNLSDHYTLGVKGANTSAPNMSGDASILFFFPVLGRRRRL